MSDRDKKIRGDERLENDSEETTAVKRFMKMQKLSIQNLSVLLLSIALPRYMVNISRAIVFQLKGAERQEEGALDYCSDHKHHGK